MSNIYEALSKNKIETGAPARPAAEPFVPGHSSAAHLPELADPGRDREMAALRQRILLEVGLDRSLVLTFTGSVPGEGASTLALHFARDLAASEERMVLLVDADFGRAARSLTGALKATADGAVGLTDVLAERASLSAAVLGTEQPRLHFLPCGQDIAAPLELVRPERVHRLIGEMARHYSFIIIDAGASLLAPETAMLAANTDGVVLVVRANRTRREVVQKAVGTLNKTRCRLLGVVLNDRRYPIPGFLYRRV